MNFGAHLPPCGLTSDRCPPLKNHDLIYGMVRHDRGWAPDYVGAMWRMLQRGQPDDFVVASGDGSGFRRQEIQHWDWQTSLTRGHQRTVTPAGWISDLLMNISSR